MSLLSDDDLRRLLDGGYDPDPDAGASATDTATAAAAADAPTPDTSALSHNELRGLLGMEPIAAKSKSPPEIEMPDDPVGPATPAPASGEIEMPDDQVNPPPPAAPAPNAGASPAPSSSSEGAPTGGGPPSTPPAPSTPIHAPQTSLGTPSGPPVPAPGPPAQPPIPDDEVLLPNDSPTEKVRKEMTNNQLSTERQARALEDRANQSQTELDAVAAIRARKLAGNQTAAVDYATAVARNAAARDKQIADMRAHVVDPRRLMNQMSAYDIAGIGALAALSAGAGGDAAANYLKNAVDEDNQYQKNRYDSDSHIYDLMVGQQNQDRDDYTTRNFAAKESLADELEVAASKMDAGTVKDNTVLAVEKMRADNRKELDGLAAREETIRVQEAKANKGKGVSNIAPNDAKPPNPLYPVFSGHNSPWLDATGKQVPIWGSQPLPKNKEGADVTDFDQENKDYADEQDAWNDLSRAGRKLKYHAGLTGGLGDSFKDTDQLEYEAARTRLKAIMSRGIRRSGEAKDTESAMNAVDPLVPSLKMVINENDPGQLIENRQDQSDERYAEHARASYGQDVSPVIAQAKDRRQAPPNPTAQQDLDAANSVVNDPNATLQQKHAAEKLIGNAKSRQEQDIVQADKVKSERDDFRLLTDPGTTDIDQAGAGSDISQRAMIIRANASRDKYRDLLLKTQDEVSSDEWRSSLAEMDAGHRKKAEEDHNRKIADHTHAVLEAKAAYDRDMDYLESRTYTKGASDE